MTMRCGWLLVVAGVAGCGGPQDPDDLDAPHGGFSFAAEAPLFGPAHRADFSVAGESSASQAVQDASVPAQTSKAATTHAVWAVWGRNPQAAVPAAWSTWDGTLATTSGTLVARRTLAFERQDGLDEPPNDQTVRFHSRTRPAVDGVVALSNGGESASFGSALMTLRADLEPAVTRQQGSTPDQEESALLLTIPLPTNGACSHAVMTGRVRPVRHSGLEGRVVGRVWTPQGDLVGHWRAIFGTRRDGARVLWGKLIDAQGQPLARLTGTATADRSGFDVVLVDPADLSLGHVNIPISPGTRGVLPQVAALEHCLVPAAP